MKKGFTLVELSIVLVIIGLLIGGILAAQSMIGTAKIHALIRQVGQFDAAVENFQTKYQQLPGDTNLMGGNSAGNNDGVILGPGNGSANEANMFFSGELGNFWFELSQSGLTNPLGSGYKQMGSYQGFPDFTYLPQASVGSNASIVGLGSPTTKKNYYLIMQLPGFPLNVNGALKIIDVSAIDTKLDDGLANSGNVQGWGGTSPKNTASNVDQLENPDGNGNCSTGGAYSVTATYLCEVRIRMGSSNGNPK